MDFQRTELIGEIRKIDQRKTPNGQLAVSLGVLVKERHNIVWFRCTAFGVLAEDIIKDAKDGQEIFVEGRVMSGLDGNPKVWEKNGRHLSNYEIRILNYILGETNEGTSEERESSS